MFKEFFKKYFFIIFLFFFCFISFQNLFAKEDENFACQNSSNKIFSVQDSITQNLSVQINIPDDIERLEEILQEKIIDKLYNFGKSDNFGKLDKTSDQKNILVKNLTYKFDFDFDKKELSYLIGFSPGDRITSNNILSAIKSLVKKNRFEKILLSIDLYKPDLDKPLKNINSDDIVANINFDFLGSWIFSKVKVHGLWVGKLEYAKYYTIEPGEVFSIEGHKHSLDNFKKTLRSQGFFNAKITDQVNYDKQNKLVFADIFIDRKNKFKISTVDFAVKSASERIDLSGHSPDIIKEKLNKIFLNKMEKNEYSKALIERQAGEIKKYLSKKGFMHTDIELIETIKKREKVVALKFAITLHSKKEFKFIGNKFLSSSKLLELITVYGRSSWMVPVSILVGEITKEYKDRGFWDVKVEAKEESYGVEFFIKEGKRACVSCIEFLGADSFDVGLLQKAAFSNIICEKHFSQELLDSSLDDLVSFYLSQGFWDIKIDKHEFEKVDCKRVNFDFNKFIDKKVTEIKNIFTKKIGEKELKDQNSDYYKLIVRVSEGQKSFLKLIKFREKNEENKEKINFQEVLSMGPFEKFKNSGKLGKNCILLNKGQIPFDGEILTVERNWLLRYFKEKGYLHADVSFNIERNGQDISVTWEIDPGKIVTFGKTIIISSKDVLPKCVMRELQYKPGEPWDNKKLKKSVDRLRALGVYDSVHLYPYKVSVKEEEKDILLKIMPSDPYEIRTRIGLERFGVSKCNWLGNGFTYKFGGAFIWKNPFRNADQIMLDGDAALPYRNVSLSYITPWIGDHRVKTNFKVYANRYDQPGFVCSKVNLYQAKQDGFMVGFAKPNDRFDFAVNTGLEWMSTSVKMGSEILANKVAKAINFDPCLLGVKIPYLWLEPSVLLNTTDDKANPRSGYSTTFTVKGMLPVQPKYISSFFVKFWLEQAFFKAITEKLTAAVKFRVGHIFHKDFKDITPIERFYLGGAHSIRSYEKDMCPPWGIFCDDTKSFPDCNRSIDKAVSKQINDTGCDPNELKGVCSVCDQINLSNNLSKKAIYENNLDNQANQNCVKNNLTNSIANKNMCSCSPWVIAPQGGRTVFSVNLEARFNIYKAMSGVVFQDMGSLFDDNLLTTSNFSQATGVGLRFNTPVGPIRFDLGFKWKVRNEFESRYAWFLAFGNAF